MDIIIDANEFFSCIIAHGKGLNSRTIAIFFHDNVKLYAPTKLIEELKNNEKEIASKSGLSRYEYDVLIKVLRLRVSFIPFEEFAAKIKEAEVLSPHLKDIEYFALALKINAKIWSQEKAFKEQKRVEIVTTDELFSMLK